MLTNNVSLNRFNIQSYSDITIGSGFTGMNWVETVFQMNDSESRVSTDSWYGDASIGSLDCTVIIDKQWILSVGWGDGIALRRINDNGTITRVWGSDYGNGYNHHSALAFHKPTMTAYICQYNTPRMGVLDLSAWDAAGRPDNGSGIVKYDNIYQKDTTWNFPTDRVGTSYESGLKIAGDWLYMASYARDTINGVYRWNVYTREYQLLPIANLNWNTASWEGTFVYDDRLDKLFYQLRWSGGLNIIENASTENPTAYHISFSGHGADHCVYKGIVYIGGDTNRILCGGDWRFFDLDISGCNESNATPVFNREVYTSGGYHAMNNYMPFGSEDPYNEDEYRGGTPYGHAFIRIMPDRGWLRKSGWFDLDNFQPVGRTGEDNYSHQKDTVFFDYSGCFYKVTSANGTDYYIAMGYSWDGHRVNVYNKPHLLKTSSEVLFNVGDALSGNNIAAINLSDTAYEIFTPSNTTASVSVSNNGGTTWESYSSGIHTFSSAGTNCKVKYTFSGQENKMPYMKSPYTRNPTAVVYGDGYLNSSNAKTLNYKISGI